jgi:ADP-ribosyl-[dinitrogen reductase] hydrolase
VSAVKDRVEGVLVGLCIGDRNGGPVRMAIRLAESLADLGRFDRKDIGFRYLQWWREGAFDTGPTAAKVFERVDHGADFDSAARAVHEELGGSSAGCNPAHRCSPLAMASWIPIDDLPGVVKEEATQTHLHPISVDVAVAVGVLCRLLITGDDWETAKSRVAQGKGELIRNALRINSESRINAGGYAPDVLSAAIYFLDSADSFSESLMRSLDFAGPANYCPVLVGALGGARWGRSSIPERWCMDISIRARVESAARRHAASW